MVLVALAFMRIDLLCQPLRYDVWQLLVLLWSWLAGIVVRSYRRPKFK